MSEIAKCPHCGEKPDILIDLFDKHGKYPKGYRCCGAEFVELDRWNQYAAAMELAKAEIRHAKCHPADSKRLRLTKDNITAARKRVLEVFK